MRAANASSKPPARAALPVVAEAAVSKAAEPIDEVRTESKVRSGDLLGGGTASSEVSSSAVSMIGTT